MRRPAALIAPVAAAVAVVAAWHGGVAERPAAGAAGSPTDAGAASGGRVSAASGERAPIPDGGGHLIAKVRAGEVVSVRDRPGGRESARHGDRTGFGSRTALAVLELRRGGRWLGVATPELPEGRIGWVRADPEKLAFARTPRSLRVDLSERTLELREGRRVLRRVRVGIGRSSTPTPTGRFGVTDRLAGADFGPYYGCCIIAFSATQPNLPGGWRGGNRIAVHGTTSRSTIGAASSSGCLRAADEDLRRLMLEVPLGAPVTIRR